jgi:hypothetical protein
MCPVCLATLGIVAVGAVSTVGLAALAVKISRTGNSPSETITNPNEKSFPVNQHERSSHDVH